MTVVFWSLLSSPDTFGTTYNAWDNISVHALNCAFAGLEILGTNARPPRSRFEGKGGAERGGGASLPWVHLPLLIVMLGMYLGVAYITHATQGFYRAYCFPGIAKESVLTTMLWSAYNFLDPNREHGLLVAYIVGIGAGIAVLFVIVRWICILRAWAFDSLLPCSSASYLTDIQHESPRRKSGKKEEERLEEWEEVGRPSMSMSGVGVAV